jgi:2-polyprenyl-3-methyl-5-hydroxy-6-metoxy-1,4-benzoquinol methylase
VNESGSGHAAGRSTVFDRLAGTWSRVHYGPQGGMVPRIARFADALASLVPASADILDYGCGTGDIAAALAARGYRVEARDLSPAMIEQARVLYAGSGVRFAAIGAIETGADDQRFDAVVCSSVLEYVLDLPRTIESLANVLKPGGYLLATVPNIDHPVRRREPMNRALMRIALFRSLVRLTPLGPSFDLQWLSRNRMPVSAWMDLFHTTRLRPVWQDDQDHPLTLLIGRRSA